MSKIRLRLIRFSVVAALCALLAGVALFLYLTREGTVYLSFKGTTPYDILFLGESVTLTLDNLPEGLVQKDFILTDDSGTGHGACEIHGQTVTATKPGYIRVITFAKAGRTTYKASFRGYVPTMVPKITCNGVPLSGAVPVGAGEPLPGVNVWVDKGIRFQERGPKIIGDFSSFNEVRDGLKRYHYSFDQAALNQLKDDYVITVKAEYRDKPFNEIKVKYYETDTLKRVLDYMMVAALYNKPDTSTLESFLKFKGVSRTIRKLTMDDIWVQSTSGGKCCVLEESGWVKQSGSKGAFVSTSISIDLGLTSSMPPDRMVDPVNGAQYAIIMSQGSEFDGVYYYRNKAGQISSVDYYQFYFTAELRESATNKLLETIYREDTSGRIQPRDKIYAEAENDGAFAESMEVSREKCRIAIMKYVYETMWQ